MSGEGRLGGATHTCAEQRTQPLRSSMHAARSRELLAELSSLLSRFPQGQPTSLSFRELMRPLHSERDKGAQSPLVSTEQTLPRQAPLHTAQEQGP